MGACHAMIRVKVEACWPNSEFCLLDFFLNTCCSSLGSTIFFKDFETKTKQRLSACICLCI